DVSLGVELQAVVLLWLSVGVKVDISVNLGGGLIGNLLTFVLNTVTELLSSILGGVLSILTGGESLLSLSLEARAQLAAVIAGAVDIDITTDIRLTLLGWLTG